MVKEEDEQDNDADDEGSDCESNDEAEDTPDADMSQWLNWDICRRHELERLFKGTLVTMLLGLWRPSLKEACYGCLYAKDSQLDHDICAMTPTDVRNYVVFKHAYSKIKASEFLDNWHTVTLMHLDPPPNPFEMEYMRKRVNDKHVDDDDNDYAIYKIVTACSAIMGIQDNVTLF